jgi:Uncharacterised protein conserved in bacteria (DUF2336)
MHPAARLSELLALADRGPAMRAAVAEEVAEILADWPSDCPPAMRNACENLLARAAWDVDDATLVALRLRLRSQPELAALVLPPEDSDRRLTILARRGHNISPEMARVFNLPRARIKDILADHSGISLAIACKGLGLSRATFSALVIVMSGKSPITKIHERLDCYDAVNAAEAARLLHGWRDSAVAERAA